MSGLTLIHVPEHVWNEIRGRLNSIEHPMAIYNPDRLALAEHVVEQQRTRAREILNLMDQIAK